MRKVIPKDAVLIPDNAERVFSGVIYDVFQWQQEQFDGTHATYEMLKRPDTVAVIGVVDDKLLVINDEQSHAGTKLSFPGGRVEPNESSTLAAAQREMREETGYSFKSWRLINVWQPFVKIEWFVYVYVAWEVSGGGKPMNDPGENIQVKHLTFDEVYALAKKGEGYLGEDRDTLEEAQSISGLYSLPEFKGQEVDR